MPAAAAAIAERAGADPGDGRDRAYASEIHRIVIKSPTQADVFVDDGNVEISRHAYRGRRVEGG